MTDSGRPSLQRRFADGANQRWKRAGRVHNASCCRGNRVVTVYGIVPVDWKLPPFRQGINLLIDTVYFIVTFLNTITREQESPTERTCGRHKRLNENRPSLLRLGTVQRARPPAELSKLADAASLISVRFTLLHLPLEEPKVCQLYQGISSATSFSSRTLPATSMTPLPEERRRMRWGG